MRSISTIYPAITENTEYSIVKVHAPLSIFKADVSLDYGVLLPFIVLAL